MKGGKVENRILVILKYVFDYKAYVYIPMMKRRKFDDKSVLLIFMGSDEQLKGLRFVNIGNNKVYISRDYR